MKNIEWTEIQYAVKVLLDSSQINKLEGKNWLVYKVGYIIRIDIKP